jgi:hypothetical protein
MGVHEVAVALAKVYTDFLLREGNGNLRGRCFFRLLFRFFLAVPDARRFTVVEVNVVAVRLVRYVRYLVVRVLGLVFVFFGLAFGGGLFGFVAHFVYTSCENVSFVVSRLTIV